MSMVFWQARSFSLVYPIIPVQVKAQFDWIILSSDGMPPPQSFKAFLSPTVAHSLQMGTSGSAISTVSDQCQVSQPGMLAFCVRFAMPANLRLICKQEARGCCPNTRSPKGSLLGIPSRSADPVAAFHGSTGECNMQHCSPKARPSMSKIRDHKCLGENMPKMEKNTVH